MRRIRKQYGKQAYTRKYPSNNSAGDDGWLPVARQTSEAYIQDERLRFSECGAGGGCLAYRSYLPLLNSRRRYTDFMNSADIVLNVRTLQ